MCVLGVKSRTAPQIHQTDTVTFRFFAQNNGLSSMFYHVVGLSESLVSLPWAFSLLMLYPNPEVYIIQKE
jgi:hypothetical protein